MGSSETTRSWRTLVLGLFVALSACATAAPAAQRHSIGERDFIEQLAPGVWRHVTYQNLPKWGPFPANGLVVRTSDGRALIVDATWTDAQARRVIRWAERHVGKVVGLVVTHAHNDRDGGRRAFEARDIPAVASIDALGVDGEVFFPGHAHAPDNTVVWLREAKVLFGGCMVRARSTRDLGNTADADVRSWHRAIDVLLERYPSARVVVPGHGAPGGRELLKHTGILSHSER